jgi:hypothetical protein
MNLIDLVAGADVPNDLLRDALGVDAYMAPWPEDLCLADLNGGMVITHLHWQDREEALAP